MQRYVTHCSVCRALRYGKWIVVGAVHVCPSCMDTTPPELDGMPAALADERPAGDDWNGWNSCMDAAPPELATACVPAGGTDEHCPFSKHGTHCAHWRDGEGPCCACGDGTTSQN